MGSSIQSSMCRVHQPSDLNPQIQVPRFRTPPTEEPKEPLLSNKSEQSSHFTPIKNSFCPCHSNPFEADLQNRLHLPAVSPSVFTSVTTKDESDEKSFRWSIEQIAVLNPVEIEDVVHSQENGCHGMDVETEQRAQEAINCFFSQRQIVPSPWFQTYNHKPINRNVSFVSSVTSSGTSISKFTTAKTSDACTQTTLSLPVDFDLEEILGQFYTQHDGASNIMPSAEDDDNFLSISTLRRKLFYHEESSPPKRNGSPFVPISEEPIIRIEDMTSTAPMVHLSTSPSERIVTRTSLSPSSRPKTPSVSPIGSLSNSSSIGEEKQDAEGISMDESQNALLSMSDAQIRLGKQYLTYTNATASKPETFNDNEGYDNSYLNTDRTNQPMIFFTDVASESKTFSVINSSPTLLTSQDTGYHTYQSTIMNQDSIDDVIHVKRRMVMMSPVRVDNDNELRMSWAPTQASTPTQISRRLHCDMSMSLDLMNGTS